VRQINLVTKNLLFIDVTDIHLHYMGRTIVVLTLLEPSLAFSQMKITETPILLISKTIKLTMGSDGVLEMILMLAYLLKSG
jgi:hypothetical protein